MNKQRFYCLLTVFIIAVTLIALTGCNRNKKTPYVAKQKTPAELASEKINEYSHPNAVISSFELNNNLSDPNWAILDTRGRSFQVFAASYPVGHIPGAIPILHAEYTHPAYFDRLAPPVVAQKTMGDKGVNNQKRVVLYGNDGLQGRVYWMLKVYGCDNPVQILDGGIEKWQEAGFQTTVVASPITPGQFEFNEAKADPNIYTTLEEVVDSILKYTPNKIIVDARSKKEYLVGHIPMSVNISVDEILNDDKTFKTMQELTTIAGSKGVTPDKTVLVYSNNGVRSSLVWYVLHELMGYPSVKNYDAGVYEWNERELAIESGEQKLVVKPAQ